MTLPKDALIRFAKTTREFFLNDETLKQDVVRYLELAGDASSIYAADGDGESVDPEEQQKELWAQAEAVLDNLVEEMENTIGDVTMDVYVRKDGKMAGFPMRRMQRLRKKMSVFTAMFPLAAVTTCCRM